MISQNSQRIRWGNKEVFGAAADGDADRNMILGKNFFVTPSDSLAILADHANIIPFFAQQGGIKSVARSMPTSGAVDRVAKNKNLNLFETPTGWKFFGNVMDSKTQFGGVDYNPVICGEESFGTGSNHVREKDGLWAVLAWLQILAHYNKDSSSSFIHVEDIVTRHWQTYGRNYYCRYDYEGVSTDAAQAVMNNMRSQFKSLSGPKMGSFTVATADEFTYLDPIDGSVSTNQGIRVLMEDGSRIILRLSGTAGSGATIRLYLEKYEPGNGSLKQLVADALGELVQIALSVTKIPELTGMATPTVIT
jgi:phosphoglucomutase